MLCEKWYFMFSICGHMLSVVVVREQYALHWWRWFNIGRLRQRKYREVTTFSALQSAIQINSHQEWGFSTSLGIRISLIRQVVCSHTGFWCFFPLLLKYTHRLDIQMNKDNELNINMHVGLGHSWHRHGTWAAMDQEVEWVDWIASSNPGSS